MWQQRGRSAQGRAPAVGGAMVGAFPPVWLVVGFIFDALTGGRWAFG